MTVQERIKMITLLDEMNKNVDASKKAGLVNKSYTRPAHKKKTKEERRNN